MLFSICVPAYGTEKYLSKCLDSLLSQSLSDYEIIVVDDGSPDRSGKIADEYASKDKRIHVIHQKNKGLFHARLSAMKEAQGDYIVHVDSDDWVEKDYLEKIYYQIKTYNVDIVLINDYVVQENGHKTEEISFKTNNRIWIDSYEFKEFFFNTSNIQAIWKKAIRRELIEIDELEKYPRITMTEDWIHSYYPIIRAQSAAYIREPLYDYRITSGSMTAVFDPLIIVSSKIIYELRKQYELMGEISMKITSEVWLLEKVAKTLIYNRSKVREKVRYYEYLNDLYNDKDILSLYYQYKKQIKTMYRIPLTLLFKKRFITLYFLKLCISFIR